MAGDLKSFYVTNPLNAMDVVEFENEVSKWRIKNFGKGEGYQQLLGVIEEMGEFVEVFAKNGAEEITNRDELVDAIGDFVVYLVNYCNVMGIRFDDCLLKALDIAGLNRETLDRDYPEIGDKVVSFAGLQTAIAGYNDAFPGNDRHITTKEQFSVAVIRVYFMLSKMCHSQLKSEQGIRGDWLEHIRIQRDNVACLLNYITDVASSIGIDMESAVTVTWNVVKLRDWKKNSLSGVV